jgi:hypothetical protein
MFGWIFSLASHVAKCGTNSFLMAFSNNQIFPILDETLWILFPPVMKIIFKFKYNS